MNLFQAAIDDIRDGNTAAAQNKLARVLRENPNHEQAWLWLGQIITDPQRKRQCFQQVLRINPANQTAQRELGLGSKSPPAQPSMPQPANPSVSFTTQAKPSPTQKRNRTDTFTKFVHPTVLAFLERARNRLEQTPVVQVAHEKTGLKVDIITGILEGLIVGFPILILSLLVRLFTPDTPYPIVLLRSAVLLAGLIGIGVLGYSALRNSQENEQARKTRISHLIENLPKITLPGAE